MIVDFFYVDTEGVKDTIEKSGFKDKIGEDKIFWSAVEAINYAEDSRAVI